MIKKLLLFTLVASFISSCFDINKRLGWRGESDNITKSKAESLFKSVYIPEKFTFRLFDNSLIQIDTAWAEIAWIYGKKERPIPQDTCGYNLIIPILKQQNENFNFIFSLADIKNRYGTNGIKSERCTVYPIELKDTIQILLEQRNPDTAYGWTKPIITDTIKFIKQ